MISFADEALIEVRSGKGGNGCISFRREKYIPNGGPNGGDGGRGGDVIFAVKKNLRTLADLRYKQVFKAKNGGDGQGNKRYGKDGDDVVIPLPPGTVVFDAETGEKVLEFTTESEDETFTYLKGGKGGWGNVHFKSSTNQAPRYAHSGTPGEIKKLRVELSIMADVGLVGFPNAGKSSLLDSFTNARPKIAPYPFTTKIPNLGVLRADSETDVIIADIPGIIEGASEGAGLGIRFLKHISRTQCLLFMIDCSDIDESGSFMTAYDSLKTELKEFSGELTKKPRIVLLNKIDTEKGAENAAVLLEKIKSEEKDAKVIPISVMTGEGMNDVRLAILDMVSGKKEATVASQKASKAKSSFLAARSVDDSMEEQRPGHDFSPTDEFGATIEK